MTLVRCFKSGISIHKTFASSTLLWLRTDKSRSGGCSYWCGDHSKLVAANPTFKEYRQHHFSESNLGLWPQLDNVETLIPQRRKIDGMPEVTFKSILSPFLPAFSKNNSAIMRDEKNVFMRTILHVTWPFGGRWYEKKYKEESLTNRIILLIRKRKGVNGLKFSKFINDKLARLFASESHILELRSQCFMKWNPKMWLSEGVLHDYPEDDQFHASVVIGADSLESINRAMLVINEKLCEELSLYCVAIHAYNVEKTYVYIKDGKRI